MPQKTKSTNQEMRKQTLSKIEAGALKVFAELGFYGATIQKIATASELSHGLVYHYFKSKEEIFLHLVNSSLDRTIYIAKMILEESPGSAWDKIESLSKLIVSESLKKESSPFFLLILQANSISSFTQAVSEKVDCLYSILASYIEQGQKEGRICDENPYSLAMTYFACVQGLALLPVQKRNLEAQIKPEIIMNLLQKQGTNENLIKLKDSDNET